MRPSPRYSRSWGGPNETAYSGGEGVGLLLPDDADRQRRTLDSWVGETRVACRLQGGSEGRGPGTEEGHHMRATKARLQAPVTVAATRRIAEVAATAAKRRRDSLRMKPESLLRRVTI